MGLAQFEDAPGPKLRGVFVQILRPGGELHHDRLSLQAPSVSLVPELDGNVRGVPVEQPEAVTRVHLGDDGRGDDQTNLQAFGRATTSTRIIG